MAIPQNINHSQNHPTGNNEAMVDNDDAQDDEAFDDDSSSVTSEMSELQHPEDFSRHFIERDNRLFHSHGPHLPYPLPVDGREQGRLNSLHTVASRLLGANYTGPVHEVLSAQPGIQRRSVDLCTGTGTWVLEMASEFPHVRFRGLDIVPIATRHPPRNVRFEMHDVNGQTRWQNSTVDLVHARGIGLAVVNFQNLLGEVARILRPGGLFLSCEWATSVVFDPAVRRNDVGIYALGISRFFNAVNDALNRACIRPIAGSVDGHLARLPQFDRVSVERHYVPIGRWPADPESRRIGEDFQRILEQYAGSFQPLLMRDGWREPMLNRLIVNFLREIREKRHLAVVFHVVHARRV